MSVGVLVSSYDLFNVGDLDLISQARGMCDRLVVAVMTDADVVAATGWSPVVPLSGRMSLMGHVRGVDDVVVADSSHERWGAESGAVVMTSALADPLCGGDLVMVPARRSGSHLIARLDGVSGGSAGAGVA